MGQREHTRVSKKVRDEVLERDGYKCISCGTTHQLSIAHVFINRSHGGLGVKENLCVLCMTCHHQMDNGKTHEQEYMRHLVQMYMIDKHGKINTKRLKYNKWLDEEGL